MASPVTKQATCNSEIALIFLFGPLRYFVTDEMEKHILQKLRLKGG